jgi:predicted ThiF/HesA family dinucleotide-utilizing enzyme
VGENLSDTNQSQDLVLFFVHLVGIAVGSIVVAGQVQHAVEGVEEELVSDRDVVFFGLGAGVGEADVDFAGERAAFGVEVDGEGDYVGGPFEAEELSVKVGHLFVTDEDHVEVAERRVQETERRAQVLAEVSGVRGPGGGGDGEVEGGRLPWCGVLSPLRG